MKDTVRNFAVDYQDWASQESQSYEEAAYWSTIIASMASNADPSGELTEELKENGII